MDPDQLPVIDPTQLPVIDPHMATAEGALFLAIVFAFGLALYELMKLLPKDWQ